MESGKQNPLAERSTLDRYWSANIRIMAGLLILWSLVGVFASILIADWLNQFSLPGTGFPLGFWFAQQGSIVGFVLLILAYCLLMNRLDEKHQRQLEQARQRGQQ